MKSVRLGSSHVRVSSLGFGGAVIGNLYRAVDEGAARRTVRAAWNAGIRYFDTAPHYGLGLAERRLGSALAEHPRNDFVVSTKVGRLLIPRSNPGGRRDDAGFDVPADHERRWDFSADGVRRSLESSMRRLGMDHVDVVLLHDPDEHWQQALDEAYPALHELREQGVIGAIGVGMNQAPMLQRFAVETDIDAVLLAGRYTLLDQSATGMLSSCQQRAVSVLAAGVFNGGMLATEDPSAESMYDYQAAPDAVRARARRIAELTHRHGTSLPQAAMSFAAQHPAVASVVVGARSDAEIRENADLFRRPVPDQLWTDLAVEALLAPDVPVPGRSESPRP